MTSGGRLLKRNSPSTTSASLPTTCRPVRARILAISLSIRAWLFFLAVVCAMSSTSRYAYQTSSAGAAANRIMAARYAVAARQATAAAAWAPAPLSRAATVALATKRFTSHSHGPGSVSSKSLTSNTRRRSGLANTPKLEMCASPTACTRRPLIDEDARSAAMTAAAPRQNANGDAAIRP